MRLVSTYYAHGFGGEFLSVKAAAGRPHSKETQDAGLKGRRYNESLDVRSPL